MPVTFPVLLECTAEHMRIGAGDNHPLGWGLTAGYAAAALLAARVAWLAPFPAASRGRERAFWVAFAALLAFLALNKQLDLHWIMTLVGRCVAQAQDWYEERRGVQARAIAGLAVLVVLAFALALWWLRGTWARAWLPLTAAVVLAGFVLLRAISFHHLDVLLRTEALGIRAHRWIEAAGIALALAAAALALARPRPG